MLFDKECHTQKNIATLDKAINCILSEVALRTCLFNMPLSHTIYALKIKNFTAAGGPKQILLARVLSIQLTASNIIVSKLNRNYLNSYGHLKSNLYKRNITPYCPRVLLSM